MRKKSYYTETDILPNLYTFGKEFQLEDGTEYIGLYHRYKSTGEIFTKSKWDKNQSNPLFDYIAPIKNNIVYKTLNNINLKGFSLPKNSIIFPNPENRKTGYFTRYFLKKITDNIILEVNQQQYDDWNSNKIDKNLYDGLSFKWYITGPLDDVKNGSVVTLGVISKNRKSLSDANLRMPGITESFSSLTEYYLASDLVVPKDING